MSPDIHHLSLLFDNLCFILHRANQFICVPQLWFDMSSKTYIRTLFCHAQKLFKRLSHIIYHLFDDWIQRLVWKALFYFVVDETSLTVAYHFHILSLFCKFDKLIETSFHLAMGGILEALPDTGQHPFFGLRLCFPHFSSGPKYHLHFSMDKLQAW